MDLDRLAGNQYHVVTRAQAMASGLTDDAIVWKLASGRWQRLHRGVYVTHATEISWVTRACGALLYAGEGAALGMLASAYVQGLVDRPPPNIIVVVPWERRVRKAPRVRVLRCRRFETIAVRGLAVTTIEQTVLDLGSIEDCRLDTAIGYAATAVQRRLTTPAKLARALADRSRHQWRDGLRLALGDIDAGAESVLEVRYRRDVERRHGLPAARMQVPDAVRGKAVRRDFVYEDHRLVVEVDGLLGHVGAAVSRDRRRDRGSARGGWQTMRAGWVDVVYEGCELAVDVGLALGHRGWPGRPRACGPQCAVR